MVATLARFLRVVVLARRQRMYDFHSTLLDLCAATFLGRRYACRVTQLDVTLYLRLRTLHLGSGRHLVENERQPKVINDVSAMQKEDLPHCLSKVGFLVFKSKSLRFKNLEGKL